MLAELVSYVMGHSIGLYVYPQNQYNNKKTKAVILSFDLSKNSFKEIPQPDNDASYQSLDMGIPSEIYGGFTNMSTYIW